MYCPKCGAKATDETKYCRACGQSLTLVSQAMMGFLPTNDRDQQKLESAIKYISLGIGFLIISIVIATMAPKPAFSIPMLIAGIIPLSLGVAEILARAISRSRPMSSAQRETMKETAPMLSEPPSSVTEVTTRNLDLDAEHSRIK
jgi:hypothetical protein